MALIPQMTVIAYMYLNYDKHKHLETEEITKEQDLVSKYVKKIEDLEIELADLRVYKRLWNSKFGESYKE
jgi:hypothetical protein